MKNGSSESAAFLSSDPLHPSWGEISTVPAASLAGDLTIEFRLFLEAWPDGWTDIISKFAGDDANEFCLRLKDGKRGQWFYGDARGPVTPLDWSPEESLPLGRWVHLACVRKVGQYGRLYLDGALLCHRDWSGRGRAVTTEAPLTLMGRPGTGRFHRGAMADLRIWKAARTAGEIRASMEGDPGDVSPELLGHWPLVPLPDGLLPDMVDGNHGRHCAVDAPAPSGSEEAILWEEKRNIFDHHLGIFSRHAVAPSPRWTVVEFGVGEQGLGRFYVEQFDRVLGIDVVDYSARNPGVEFHLSDGIRSTVPDGIADLTVSHSVLEHVDDLHAALAEINRVTRVGGWLFLTVDPLYFSSSGSHLKRWGLPLDQWEHLDPRSPHYLCTNPFPGSSSGGHRLNMLTSAMFLAAAGNQAWEIHRYELTFEKKLLPSYVDRSRASLLDLTTRGFKFIGRRLR